MAYDIDGVFVGTDGRLEVNAGLRLTDARIEVTKADGSPLATTVMVQAVHPAAVRYVDMVARELHRIAHRRSAPHAVPKPSRRRTREPVPCPVCHGVEPDVWDCERCEGGGVVMG